MSGHGLVLLPDARKVPVSVSVCGIGGQGVVLAGVVLGQAAVDAGLWASQSAAYTVAARGGFARSEVILAPCPQACPIAEEVDVIAGLALEGWESDRPRLRPGGIAMCEEGLGGEVPPGALLLTVPFGRLASDAGQTRSVNLVAVGAVNALLGLVPDDVLLGAANAHLGPRPGNVAALQAGAAVGRRLRGDLEKSGREQ